MVFDLDPKKGVLAHLARRPLKLVRHFAGTTYYHKAPLPPVRLDVLPPDRL
jgi:hypothetical protein